MASGTHAAVGKYVTFGLAAEQYALPVDRVREIARMTDITAVPRMPSHVSGVMNLRGKIVPVVDLRVRLQLEAAPATSHSCIIVTETVVGERRVLVGAVVDHVSDVLNVAAGEISDPPDFGQSVDTRHVRGIVTIKDRVTMLLDLDRLLTEDVLAGGHAA